MNVLREASHIVGLTALLAGGFWLIFLTVWVKSRNIPMAGEE